MAAEVPPEDLTLRDELLSACRESTWPHVVTLLDKGASLDCCDSEGLNPLHHLCLGNSYDVGLNMFNCRNEAFMANVNKQSRQGETPLFLACRLGCASLAKLFLQSGPDCVLTDAKQGSPLHVACSCGHTAVAEELLHLGRRQFLNARDTDRNTPLHLAIQGGHEDTAVALLRQGANPMLTNLSGSNAFHLAVRRRSLKIVVYILHMQGIDLDAPDGMGKTALHIASATDSPDIVGELLQRGANPSIRDDHGCTPLHPACALGHVLVILSLLDKNVDVNVVNTHHQTALTLASRNGRLEITALLLRSGAKVYLENAEDAILLANVNGHKEIGILIHNHMICKYIKSE